nr:MAG TPA: hypothetical protein [Caudoviricetes sp.]
MRTTAHPSQLNARTSPVQGSKGNQPTPIYRPIKPSSNTAVKTPLKFKRQFNQIKTNNTFRFSLHSLS